MSQTSPLVKIAFNAIKVKWYGMSLNETDWNDPNGRTLCVKLSGLEYLGKMHELFLILNADPDSKEIMLPPLPDNQNMFDPCLIQSR